MLKFTNKGYWSGNDILRGNRMSWLGYGKRPDQKVCKRLTRTSKYGGEDTVRRRRED